MLSFLRDSLLSFCFSYTKNILYGVESLFFCLISFLAYLLDTVKEYIETNEYLQNLYSAVNRFREILKSKDESRLENWLSEVKRYNIRELNTFVRSVERDIEAVKNAIRTEFSNGIIEGVINKIKVIKRIMYGRCSFELLRLKAIMS
ncbi:MAG: transposase [Mesotoga sp.]